jgi:hypothetical protein
MSMAGLRARVGERRKQDAAISIALMIEIQRRLELDWKQALGRDDLVARREVAEHAVYFLFCFCGTLASKEPRSLSTSCATKLLWMHPTDSLGRFIPQAGIPLVDTSRVRSVGNAELPIFVAAQTASGLRAGEWTKRLSTG